MGNDILSKIIDLTDLPKDEVSQELEKILVKQGFNPQSVSLGDIRQALTHYVHEIFQEHETLSAIPSQEVWGKKRPKLRLIN